MYICCSNHQVSFPLTIVCFNAILQVVKVRTSIYF